MTDTASDPTTMITEEMVEKAIDIYERDAIWREWGDGEHGEPFRIDMRAALLAIIPDIVKAEREACAAVADGERARAKAILADNVKEPTRARMLVISAVAEAIAAAIRAKGVL